MSSLKESAALLHSRQTSSVWFSGVNRHTKTVSSTLCSAGLEFHQPASSVSQGHQGRRHGPQQKGGPRPVACFAWPDTLVLWAWPLEWTREYVGDLPSAARQMSLEGDMYRRESKVRGAVKKFATSPGSANVSIKAAELEGSSVQVVLERRRRNPHSTRNSRKSRSSRILAFFLASRSTLSATPFRIHAFSHFRILSRTQVHNFCHSISHSSPSWLFSHSSHSSHSFSHSAFATFSSLPRNCKCPFRLRRKRSCPVLHAREACRNQGVGGRLQAEDFQTSLEDMLQKIIVF